MFRAFSRLPISVSFGEFWKMGSVIVAVQLLVLATIVSGQAPFIDVQYSPLTPNTGVTLETVKKQDFTCRGRNTVYNRYLLVIRNFSNYGACKLKFSLSGDASSVNNLQEVAPRLYSSQDSYRLPARKQDITTFQILTKYPVTVTLSSFESC